MVKIIQIEFQLPLKKTEWIKVQMMNASFCGNITQITSSTSPQPASADSMISVYVAVSMALHGPHV